MSNWQQWCYCYILSCYKNVEQNRRTPQVMSSARLRNNLLHTEWAVTWGLLSQTCKLPAVSGGERWLSSNIIGSGSSSYRVVLKESKQKGTFYSTRGHVLLCPEALGSIPVAGSQQEAPGKDPFLSEILRADVNQNRQRWLGIMQFHRKSFSSGKFFFW